MPPAARRRYAPVLQRPASSEYSGLLVSSSQLLSSCGSSPVDCSLTETRAHHRSRPRSRSGQSALLRYSQWLRLFATSTKASVFHAKLWVAAVSDCLSWLSEHVIRAV